MLEHRIIKTTRDLLVRRVSIPLTAETIPPGLSLDPGTIADRLLRTYLKLSGFDFSKQRLLALSSFAIYRPDRSRTMVFDPGIEPADRVAHMFHYLGHISLAPLSSKSVIVQAEPRDRTRNPEYLPIEESADEWAKSFSKQILSYAHPDNLLAQGLTLGSERITFLGRI